MLKSSWLARHWSFILGGWATTRWNHAVVVRVHRLCHVIELTVCPQALQRFSINCCVHLLFFVIPLTLNQLHLLTSKCQSKYSQLRGTSFCTSIEKTALIISGLSTSAHSLCPFLDIIVILCLLLLIPRSLKHPGPIRDSAQVHDSIHMGLEVKHPPFIDTLDTFLFNSHTKSGRVTSIDLISAIPGFTPSDVTA